MTTAQLPLKIIPRIPYRPSDFLFHEGVRDLYEQCLSLLTGQSFNLCFVTGEPRSGKTHLAIVLANALAAQGYFPRIVEGDRLDQWLLNYRTTGSGGDEAIIVDNADRYLLRVAPGGSGPFVDFVERLRVHRVSLLLLSSTPVEGLPCDSHVISRLHPGSRYTLGVPGESDVRRMIQSLAKQRGLLLSDRKLHFLETRLRRDIRSIEEYIERVGHLSRVLNSGIKFPILTDAILDELA